MKRSYKLITLAAIGILVVLVFRFSGCSSVYYYPDSRFYYDPVDYNYEYDSGFLEVERGERIHYWYFPSSTGSTKAVVLHFHGNAQNISTHFLLSAWMVRHGYDVMVFDYRGYGKSDGSPSPENTYQDALVALSHSGKKAEQASVPLIVFGQSLGGAVALRAIVDSEFKNQTALIIADSTFASYRGIVRRKAGKILFYPLNTWIAALFSDGKSSGPEVLNRIPPTPVLVMHSEQDPVVEFENGMRLFQSLQSTKKRLLIIPVAGHLAWSDGGHSTTDQALLRIMERAVDVFRDGGNPFEGKEILILED